MDDKRLKRNPAGDVERALGFGDGSFALRRARTRERCFSDRRMHGQERELRLRKPLLDVGDDGGVVVIDMETRGKEFERGEAVSGDFKQMVRQTVRMAAFRNRPPEAQP